MKRHGAGAGAGEAVCAPAVQREAREVDRNGNGFAAIRLAGDRPGRPRGICIAARCNDLVFIVLGLNGTVVSTEGGIECDDLAAVDGRAAVEIVGKAIPVG